MALPEKGTAREEVEKSFLPASRPWSLPRGQGQRARKPASLQQAQGAVEEAFPVAEVVFAESVTLSTRRDLVEPALLPKHWPVTMKLQRKALKKQNPRSRSVVFLRPVEFRLGCQPASSSAIPEAPYP